jgi:hypothetical protein
MSAAEKPVRSREMAATRGPALAQWPVIMTGVGHQDGPQDGQKGDDRSRRAGISSRPSPPTRSLAAIIAFSSLAERSLALAAALAAGLAAGSASAHAAAAVAAYDVAPAPPAPPALPVDEVANGEDEPPVEGTEVATPADEVQDLRQRMRDLEEGLALTQETVVRQRPFVTIGGYVDAGFFAAQGDGTGIVQDLGPASSRIFPAYAGRYGWVFLGDLLAPAVNSRGEAADLGTLPGVDRFDSVHSGGAPGFILNEVNLTLGAAVAANALVTASFDFVPRSGVDFRLGDVFEVDLAQLEWMPTRDRRTSIFVGKMESVLGIEYRERKASQRFGITPSLIARYTTGTPLGIKVRSKMGDNDWLIVAAAVTNGSSTIETFHFYDEIDSNAGKTLSGRVALAFGPGLFELGLSAEYGAQDHAQDSYDPLWFGGADVQAHLGRVELKAQWLTGGGTGETGLVYAPPHRPYGLRLNKGAYLEADVMLTPRLGLLARAELRDADVWLGNPDAPGGAERIYVTRGWRVTTGLRFAPNEHIAVKAEYLRNGEYGGVPDIRDDVFTSSLVLTY